MALIYDSGCGSSAGESTRYSSLRALIRYEPTGEVCYTVETSDGGSAIGTLSDGGSDDLQDYSMTKEEYRQFVKDLAISWWNKGYEQVPDAPDGVTYRDLFIRKFGDVTLEEALARIDAAAIVWDDGNGDDLAGWSLQYDDTTSI